MLTAAAIPQWPEGVRGGGRVVKDLNAWYFFRFSFVLHYLRRIWRINAFVRISLGVRSTGGSVPCRTLTPPVPLGTLQAHICHPWNKPDSEIDVNCADPKTKIPVTSFLTWENQALGTLQAHICHRARDRCQLEGLKSIKYHIEFC